MREKVIIGYRGEIGSALCKILEAEWGIDLNTVEKLKHTIKYTDPRKFAYHQFDEIPKGLIMHICIPWSDKFFGIVFDYIEKLKPKMVFIHSSVPPGTTYWVAENFYNLPVIHAPINGRHPRMEKEIRKYTMFVGPAYIIDEWGQEACEYLEYYGLNTYLCTRSKNTEFAKLMSTEFLKVQIEFFQKMKKWAEESIDWAEVIEFFKAINYKTFQRAGRIDSKMSGKHCLNNNNKIIKEWLFDNDIVEQGYTPDGEDR